MASKHLLLLVLVVLAVLSSRGELYDVGDDHVWAFQKSSENFSKSWDASKTFVVGDHIGWSIVILYLSLLL